MQKYVKEVKVKKEKYCSKEEISNIILDYQNGQTVKYISEKYNRAVSTIIIKLTEADIYKKRNLNLTEKDMEFIKERYSNGRLDEIFEAYPKLKKDNLLYLMSKNKVKSNFKWNDEETLTMNWHECLIVLKGLSVRLG